MISGERKKNAIYLRFICFFSKFHLNPGRKYSKTMNNRIESVIKWKYLPLFAIERTNCRFRHFTLKFVRLITENYRKLLENAAQIHQDYLKCSRQLTVWIYFGQNGNERKEDLNIFFIEYAYPVTLACWYIFEDASVTVNFFLWLNGH